MIPNESKLMRVTESVSYAATGTHRNSHSEARVHASDSAPMLCVSTLDVVPVWLDCAPDGRTFDA